MNLYIFMHHIQSVGVNIDINKTKALHVNIYEYDMK